LLGTEILVTGLLAQHRKVEFGEWVGGDDDKRLSRAHGIHAPARTPDRFGTVEAPTVELLVGVPGCGHG
jgi:hypothetical protein